MTGFKTATLNCDWEAFGLQAAPVSYEDDPAGCPGWLEAGFASIPDTRKAAKRHGWSEWPGVHHAGRADLCPAHTREMKKNA